MAKYLKIGYLYGRNCFTYRTKSTKNYDCKWMTTSDVRIYGYEIRTYPATIRTGEDIIHQAISNTRCKISDGHCEPGEDKKLIMIYGALPKLGDIYRNLGVHEVTVTSTVT